MKNIEILVPDLPESVSDATVGTWYKKPGDAVKQDEVLVEIETDKVVMEVPASSPGILQEILQPEGATVVGSQSLGRLLCKTSTDTPTMMAATATASDSGSETLKDPVPHDVLSPAVRRLVAEHTIDPSSFSGSGVSGRLTRQDIEHHLSQKTVMDEQYAQPQPNIEVPVKPRVAAVIHEKRVPMSRLRKRIAERLLEATRNTAMLTTFNEVNMQPVMALRREYAEAFEKRHGVRLGVMSFYVQAVVSALQHFTTINAWLDGEDIVYHQQVDISIAVSTPRGLVTPILRNCAALSMAAIEQQIREYALQGRDGRLTVEALTGGNFTITNGGLYGSLMSTPIINPPQSSILGLHAIKERPVAVNGQVVILPMMYLALSYDHRLIDGQEAVSFLVAVKEAIESPVRLLLDL